MSSRIRLVVIGITFCLLAGAALHPLRAAAGDPDSAWSDVFSGAGSDGTIQALVRSGSDLYACGNFTQVDGVAAQRIAKRSGTDWSALGQGLGDTASDSCAAMITIGGELYAAGRFTTAGGIPANSIARWDGTTWSALGSGLEGGVNGGAYVFALAATSTDLYAGGLFYTAGGTPTNSVARWNGTSWSALGSETSGFATMVTALAVIGDDVFVAWRRTNGAASYVAKWNGSTWSTLGGEMLIVDADGTFEAGSIHSLTVLGSDLYVAGDFTHAGAVDEDNLGVRVNGVAKWNGSSWSALGQGLGDPTGGDATLALTAAGIDLYAAGSFSTASGVQALGIAKWNGSAWSALGSGITPVSGPRAITAIASDLYVGGSFTMAGGAPAGGLARWTIPVDDTIAGAVVGAAGAAFSSDLADVAIPAGALATDTVVRVAPSQSAEAFTLADGVALAIAATPHGTHFAEPVSITVHWQDRDDDGVVDRGTCVGGADAGASCDQETDCASGDCTIDASSLMEGDMVLKRNGDKFSRQGFGAGPFPCSSHAAGGGCDAATANCSSPAGTATATVAQCCDPSANSWTFQTCDFSAFFVGATAGDLVPGGGSPYSDCALEWQVHNPGNVPYVGKTGLPNTVQTCTDGDPACDTDGVADGICMFQVEVCVLLDDARIKREGMAACPPSDFVGGFGLQRWAITSPRPDDKDPSRAAVAASLRSAVSDLIGGGGVQIGGKHGEVLTPTSSFTVADSCSGNVQIPVKASQSKKDAILLKTLALTAPGTSGKALKDADKLSLVCRPAG